MRRVHHEDRPSFVHPEHVTRFGASIRTAARMNFAQLGYAPKPTRAVGPLCSGSHDLEVSEKGSSSDETIAFRDVRARRRGAIAPEIRQGDAAKMPRVRL